MYNSMQINMVEGRKRPATPKYDSKSFIVWKRSLYQRMLSVFDITLPEEWENQMGVKDYFYHVLYNNGVVCVFNEPKFGLVFNPCTLGGYNMFYQPVKAIVTNPLIQEGHREMVIGKDCGLIRISPDYKGITEIVDFYAEKLALLDSALAQSFINQRLTTIVSVSNKASAETIKKAFDNTVSGDPIVVIDNEVGAERSNILDSNGYISDKQLTDIQSILNMFDSEIGIPTTSKEKSQYISDTQIDTKQSDGSARVNLWLDCVEHSIEECKKVFPELNITIKYNYEEKEVDSNGEDNTMGAGTQIKSE